MRKLDQAQDRALELLGEIGDGLRKKVPDKAVQWLETGAALGALRAGSKVAGTFVRRNPVLVGAAVLGAGVLWFAARQRNKQRGVIEGQAQRLPGDAGQDEYGV
jgi:hypothetical protein